MKTFKHSRKEATSRSNSRKTAAELLRLIHSHLMSPQSGAHTNFTRVNLEGSNVGSTMIIRRAPENSEDLPGGRSCINVYVSNNIQGVNNSILVGSSVQMGNPGVQFCLGEEQLHWMNRDEKANGDSIMAGCRLFGFLLCFAIVILLFFVTRNKPSQV